MNRFDVKSFLIISCLVTSIFATEQHISFDVGFVQPNSADVVPFLAEHNTPKKRAFEVKIGMLLPDGKCIHVSPCNIQEFPSIKLSSHQNNASTLGQGSIKAFLSARHISVMQSMEKVKQQIKQDLEVTLSDSDIFECEKKLAELKTKLGNQPVWLELDQLTSVKAQNSNDATPNQYKSLIVGFALDFAKKQMPDLKLIRVYLKETETDQINGYGVYGFKKSEYQYMTSSGLIVYEKDLQE